MPGIGVAAGTAFAQGTHGARPAAAASNQGYYYFETDTLTLFQSTGSTWVQLAPAANLVGGSVATDAIWDAVGDLAVGTGSNTAAKLAKGSALQGLQVKSDASTLEYAYHAYNLIQEIVVGAGGQATLDFQSIPATYTHLHVIFQGRCDRAAQASDELRMKFNNDGTAAYDFEHLKAGNVTVSCAPGVADTSIRVGYVTAANATAGKASGVEILIHNYRRTTWHKTALAKSAYFETELAAGCTTFQHAGLWRNTAAISRVTLFTLNNASFLEGTVASLYGIL